MSRFVFAAALVCTAPAFAETGYFAQIEDLPLPTGFAEVAPSFSFEGADGRIVVAHAEGAAEGLVVHDFYYGALPQLGWAVSPRTDGVLVFQRGREALSFTVERSGGRTRLGVRLVTQPAAMDAD